MMPFGGPTIRMTPMTAQERADERWKIRRQNNDSPIDVVALMLCLSLGPVLIGALVVFGVKHYKESCGVPVETAPVSDVLLPSM